MEAGVSAALPTIKGDQVNWDACGPLAASMIDLAIKDARDELIKDPMSFGPAQRFLLDHTTDCAERNDSTIRIWCDILGLHMPSFIDWMADRLDRLADELAASANVIVMDVDHDVTDDEAPHPITMELLAGLPVHHRPERERIRRRPTAGTAVQLDLIAA